MISQHFGNVITLGTGSDTLVEQINRLDNDYIYGMSQPPDGEARFPEFSTLSRNLVLLANLYWKEFTDPYSIFKAWGGAYDIIYQDRTEPFNTSPTTQSSFVCLMPTEQWTASGRPMF